MGKKLELTEQQKEEIIELCVYQDKSVRNAVVTVFGTESRARIREAELTIGHWLAAHITERDKKC